jgi:D-proline reductase (dithiol) PrdB
VSISIVREITVQVRPPRAMFLPWPLGHPLGEPDNPAQQSWALLSALGMLESASLPGTLVEPAYEWGGSPPEEL